SFFNQQRAIPSKKFSEKREREDKRELRVISRGSMDHPQPGNAGDFLHRLSDVGREKILVRRVLALPPRQLVIKQVPSRGAQIMERRKLVSAPKGKPIGPA